MLRSKFRSVLRSSRRRAFAGVALVALVGGGLAYRAQHAAGPAATAAAQDRLRLSPGETLHYGVAWSGTQRGRLFGAATAASDTHATTTVDLSLAMDAVVESVTAEEALLVVSFTSVDRHMLSALSSEVFPTHEAATSALVGHRARVRLGLDGAPRDVAFEQGAPDLFVNTMQWVIAQSGVSLGAGAAWDTTERGPFGRSVVHYARGESGLTRTRTKYESFDAFTAEEETTVTKLAGTTSIRLKDGALDLVKTSEAVHVVGKGGELALDGTIEFELALRAIDHGALVATGAAFGSATPAGQPVIGAETRAQLLEQRVAGMTRAQVIGDLTTMGNSGTMPEHTRWLWRVTGLLQQDPKLSPELTKIALAPASTDKLRALVLDLFASVGHPEAQAEMRNILRSPALARSGALPSLIQRVSFLDAPEPATVAMVWDGFRDAKAKGSSDLMTASAHSLAAASRHLAQNGDAPGAHQLVQQLHGEVDGAANSASKAELLSAFSNAADPEVAAIAKPYATSDDGALREAAASALRKTDTHDATALLLGLAGDPDPAVQTSALGSLAERTLSAADWAVLSQLVAAGRIGAGFDGAMLNLATAYLGQVPVVTQMIAGIGARPEASSATRARAGAMLASVRG